MVRYKTLIWVLCVLELHEKPSGMTRPLRDTWKYNQRGSFAYPRLHQSIFLMLFYETFRLI